MATSSSTTTKTGDAEKKPTTGATTAGSSSGTTNAKSGAASGGSASKPSAESGPPASPATTPMFAEIDVFDDSEWDILEADDAAAPSVVSLREAQRLDAFIESHALCGLRLQLTGALKGLIWTGKPTRHKHAKDGFRKGLLFGLAQLKLSPSLAANIDQIPLRHRADVLKYATAQLLCHATEQIDGAIDAYDANGNEVTYDWTGQPFWVEVSQSPVRGKSAPQLRFADKGQMQALFNLFFHNASVCDSVDDAVGRLEKACDESPSKVLELSTGEGRVFGPSGSVDSSV